MHPVVRDEVYRIGYEAIRNAVCTLRPLNWRSSSDIRRSYLRVGDNGVGIDPLLRIGEGRALRLQGMRERAARIAAHSGDEFASGTKSVIVPEAYLQTGRPFRHGRFEDQKRFGRKAKNPTWTDPEPSAARS